MQCGDEVDLGKFLLIQAFVDSDSKNSKLVGPGLDSSILEMDSYLCFQRTRTRKLFDLY